MVRDVIDAHGHVWGTPDAYEWVEPVMPPGITRMTYSVDDYREDMAAMGVDRAVLVATPIHGPGSPYTVSRVRADPETFYGIVLVDYDAPDVVAHLSDVVGHERLLGVRMTADDLAAAPSAYWEWMNDRGKQVHLLLSPDELEASIEYVDAFPGVDFVFDHLGAYPSVDGLSPLESPYGRMRVLADYPNTYVKITHTPSDERFPFDDIGQHVRLLVDAFGSKRLLWGSDYIYHFKRVTPWQTVEFLDELPFLSSADRADLLGRTFEEQLL